jgi:tellurite resistance protein
MIFLIIFGTRGVTYTTAHGEFHCPGCDGRHEYHHKRVRRFFTLYFIPIIPLDMLGEYIECQNCKDTYKLNVLSYDPSAATGEKDGAFQAEFHAAVKRVMVMMMMADGRIDDEEVETIRLVFGKLSDREVSKEEVDKEVTAVQSAQSEGQGLRQYLNNVSATLNDSGKELVVKAAFFVAAADGKITEEETALLAELAGALEMSPAHFKGVIDALLPEVGTTEASA